MKDTGRFRFILGPSLVLPAAAIFFLLTHFGVVGIYDEITLFTIVVFSSFYAGVRSGLFTILVATAVNVLIALFPRTFPDFTGNTSQEDAVLGIMLLLVVVMVGGLRKRLSMKLEQAENVYRIVVENMADIFFLISADFKGLYYISPAYEKITGRPVSDMQKNPGVWIEDVHPEDRKAITGYIQSLLEGTSPAGRESEPFRTIRPDKTVRWLVTKAVVLRDKEGKNARLAGISRDITHEIALKASEVEARKRFKAVLENAPVAIFSTDKDGILTFREGRGGKRARVKPGQDVGVSYFEQFKDEPKHLENVRRALKGETVSDRLIIRDGFYEIVYAPIRNAEGGNDGMVGIATDITERQAAEAEVQELSELKNKFITVVSHQLRTPLSAVRWNLETILAENLGKLKKGQSDFLHVTYLANAEVITRINDFLLALDIEEGRSSAMKETVSLESLCASVMIEVKKKCALKELDCEYEAPKEHLPTTQADTDKIRLVMEKLAENAVLYTQKGSVKAKLSFDKGIFRFVIVDTGIGIPKAERTRIFHRFFRCSNALLVKTDASGLGLYIAKHYVEKHGGKIGFESEEGMGSTFWFELPLL